MLDCRAGRCGTARQCPQRLSHEIVPHRNRRDAALLVAAERPKLIETDPGGADQIGLKPTTRVTAFIRRARFTGKIAATHASARAPEPRVTTSRSMSETK